jgi:hypothetical protein
VAHWSETSDVAAEKAFFRDQKLFFAHPLEGFKGCSFTTYRVSDGLFFVATQKKVFRKDSMECSFTTGSRL